MRLLAGVGSSLLVGNVISPYLKFEFSCRVKAGAKLPSVWAALFTPTIDPNLGAKVCFYLPGPREG